MFNKLSNDVDIIIKLYYYYDVLYYYVDIISNRLSNDVNESYSRFLHIFNKVSNKHAPLKVKIKK